MKKFIYSHNDAAILKAASRRMIRHDSARYGSVTASRLYPENSERNEYGIEWFSTPYKPSSKSRPTILGTIAVRYYCTFLKKWNIAIYGIHEDGLEFWSS